MGSLKTKKLHDAKQEANSILQTQKKKTGYAILGTPPVKILIDTKIPDEITNRSKIV